MHETSSIEARLRQAATLPGILAASFDAFEAIRHLARYCETRVPELFAAFMTAAAAAVDGRDAVTIAPSIPPPDGNAAAGSAPAPGTEVTEIADTLAALATVLDSRLSHASTLAIAPGDRAACQGAAHAALQIRQLMARADDRSGIR